MADDRVEILIRARDEATATLNNAIRSVVKLNSETARTGALGKANFRDFSNALSLVSPAAGQVATRMEAAAGAASSLVPGLGAVAGGAAAAAVGLGLLAAAGLASAKAFGANVERLDNLSAATDTSIQNLQVLQEVFKRAGLGAEAADTSLIRLNKAIAEQNPLLAKLGITARDPTLALLQLSEAFEGSSDEAAKTKIAFELMGRGSADVLKVIDGLAAKFPGLREEMAKTGQLLSGDMVDAGKTFDAEWDKFTGRWEGFMTRIGGAAATAANAIIEHFSKAPPPDKIGAEVTLRRLRKALAELQQETGGFSVTGRFKELTEQISEVEKRLGITGATAKKVGEEDLPFFARAGVPAVDKVGAAVDSLNNKLKKTAEISFETLAKVLGQAAKLPALKDVTPDVGNLVPSKTVDVPELRLFADTSRLAEVKQEWLDTFADIESAAGIFDAAVSTAFFGIQDAFATVVSTMISGGNVMKLRLSEIFKSMVDAAIRELARLVAAKALRFLLNVFGLAEVATVVGAVSGPSGGPHAGRLPAAPSGAGPASPTRTLNQNITLQISAIDAGSVDDYFNSPLGKGRLSEMRAQLSQGF